MQIVHLLTVYEYMFRYCDIDSQGNKALVMKQYLSNEKVTMSHVYIVVF
jgi:hypothetical protein